MKLIHLSDLHLGKRVNDFSMIEDQKDILIKILGIISEEKPDGVLIAGDVYDKSVPSAEAVELFDDFLVRLSRLDTQVFIISGNHDSAERLAFGGRIMDVRGIHLSPVYSGKVEPVTLKDAHGEVDIYMLPFIKPANVRRFIEDDEQGTMTYSEAVGFAVSKMSVDKSRRNVLVTHQFVTGASRSDSGRRRATSGSSTAGSRAAASMPSAARTWMRTCGTPSRAATFWKARPQTKRRRRPSTSSIPVRSRCSATAGRSLGETAAFRMTCCPMSNHSSSGGNICDWTNT